MKITTEIMGDGSIVCETQCDTRHYRSRYRGYTLREAKSKFTKRVVNAEQEELDRVRREAIYMCLHCKKSAKDCKGKCIYRPKSGRKMPRSKTGEVI